MTTQNRNTIKNNWLNATTLIALLTFIVYQSQWQKSTDGRISALEKHANDREMHMPYRQRSQLFVPRIEIDSRLKNIESYLIKIENKLDK